MIREVVPGLRSSPQPPCFLPVLGSCPCQGGPCCNVLTLQTEKLRQRSNHCQCHVVSYGRAGVRICELMLQWEELVSPCPQALMQPPGQEAGLEEGRGSKQTGKDGDS